MYFLFFEYWWTVRFGLGSCVYGIALVAELSANDIVQDFSYEPGLKTRLFLSIRFASRDSFAFFERLLNYFASGRQFD